MGERVQYPIANTEYPMIKDWSPTFAHRPADSSGPGRASARNLGSWKFRVGYWILSYSLILSLPTHAAPESLLHPTFPIVDAQGQDVRESGEPASPMQTCAGCHDTAHIAAHSTHRNFDMVPTAKPGMAIGIRPGCAPRESAVEMNCFLCHLSEPNNAARLEALKQGRPEWAATATLLGTGILKPGDGDTPYQWADDAFTTQGHLTTPFSQMQPAQDHNCGTCHGIVHNDRFSRPTLGDLTEGNCCTLTTGQIFSPERVSESGLNIPNKHAVSRPFDVHSARLVSCTECHHSVNNPTFYREASDKMPDHLAFDPRRMALSEYLHRPSHFLATGRHRTGDTGTRFAAPMRHCRDCHASSQTHQWLPYKDRHFDVLSCEACHIPKLYAPARSVTDWTMLSTNGKPRMEFRGIQGDPDPVHSLVDGYEPILLREQQADGKSRLTPHNLITSLYWIEGDPAAPIGLAQLKAAFLQGDAHHPDLLAALDSDGDGQISSDELALSSDAAIRLARQRLEAVGCQNPRIQGDVHAYPIHHNVATREWAIRDCQTCHDRDSKLYAPMSLGGIPPTMPAPTFADDNVGGGGVIESDADGALQYRLPRQAGGMFVLGHDRISWAGRLGALSFLALLLGITVHSAFRVVATRRRRRQHEQEGAAWHRVYLYTAYQRFWHWLQAAAILGLIFTGILVHYPAALPGVDFAWTVYAHNILGFILLFNAFFAAFYHFASEKIRHYLPEPQGFFSQIMEQLDYYVRGIFKQAPHPFEKTPEKKLNPLQRITYLMILNILLPLQILTGLLTWGAQRWPALTEALGGLGVLIPIHSFAAWLFAGFLVMHMYLTTTGHTVTSNLKAMVTGWEDLKVSDERSEGTNDETRA